MSRSPELSEVLAGVAAGVAADVRVAMPARVERWDAATQTVDCKPVVRQAYTDEDGARAVADLPVIPNVPVLIPKGFWCEPVPGDFVLLVFSDSSLDKWLQVGGGPLDPESDERHHIANALAITGLVPFSAARVLASYESVALGDALKAYLDTHTHAYASPTGPALTTPPVTDPAGVVPAPSPAPSATAKVTT